MVCPNPHLKNHGAVRIACEKSSVSSLGCLKMSRDAHFAIAQSDFHVSVVVFHEGSVRREKEGHEFLNFRKCLVPAYFSL